MSDIQWRAPEYETREKTPSWYWLSIAVTSVILALAVWQRNFLFAVFIIIAEILILFWGNEKPRERAFALGEKGIRIDDAPPIPYSRFDAFSVLKEEGSGWAEFALRYRVNLKPSLKVLVPGEKVEAVENLLSSVLSQIEPHDTLTDTLEKLFRF